MDFYGRKILSESGFEESEYEKVRIPPPSAAKQHPIPARLVLSIGIAGAVLLFLSYIAMRRYASRRRRSPLASYSIREDFADGLREPAIDHPAWYIRTIGLPQSAVDSIRRFTYRSGGGGGVNAAADCSVCLSEFEDGDGLRLLPKCSHAFHVACIDTWLRSHTNCPLCRAPVLDAAAGRSDSAESASSLTSDGRRSREEIEIRVEVEGSGGIRNGSGNSNSGVVGGEMKPMRRSVSLDFSSAVNNVGRKKPVSRTRSVSLSGTSIPV